jgi:hypothetical protein
MSQHIVVDISEVPAEKQNDIRFLAALEDVRRRCADPMEMEAISIHEAGHLFYMTRAGLRDPECNGPRIVYNPLTDKFDRYGSSVRCPNQDKEHLATTPISKWVFQMAKSYVGGGVAAHVLAGAADVGDSGDRENFDGFYDEILRQQPNVKTTHDEMWAEAQRIVTLELQDDGLQSCIRRMAAELKPLLFRTRSSNSPSPK